MISKKKALIMAIPVCLIITAIIALLVIFTPQKAKSTCMVGDIELPKAPHYDESKNAIYFSNLFASEIMKYVPGEKNVKRAKIAGGTEAIAFVIPLTDKKDEFIISYACKVATVKWDGESQTAQMTVLGNISDSDEIYRANFGKVAPSGNLFIGTHSPLNADKNVQPKSAGLYSYDKSGKSKKILDKVTIANGMGWSKDSKKFYFIDSLAYTVESFDYNCTDDSITNRELVLNFKDKNLPGVPDGMAVDNDGKLWITSWNGTFVVRVCPEKKEIMKQYEYCANKISSAVFAKDKLFIMTAQYELTPEEKQTYTEAGWIIQNDEVTVGGCPGLPFDLQRK